MKIKYINYFSFAFAFALGVSLVSCGGESKPSKKDGPVYEGMSIRSLYNENGPKRANEVDSSTSAPETLTKDIEDLVEIEVKTDELTHYYVKPKEKFILTVNLKNPYNFEIQSFTLNGKKYANYMFEQDSDLEHLNLKVEAPEISGYASYTIDAIKYIDGEEIKDVDLSKGEQSIKVGVTYESEPEAFISSKKASSTKLVYDVELSDYMDLIKNKSVNMYLSDGDKVVAKQELKIGSNHVVFDNLVDNKDYQYAIMTSYDLCDGNNEKVRVLDKNVDKTLPLYEMKDVLIDKTSIDFKLQRNEELGEFKKATLYDKANHEIIFESIDETKLKFSDLLSNHEYLIEVEYSYLVDKNNFVNKITYEFKTEEMSNPIVEFSNVVPTKNAISFDYNITVIDAPCTFVNIELYKGEELIETIEENNKFVFANLKADTLYTMKLNYTYDLNDGRGILNGFTKEDVTTLAKFVPVYKLENLTPIQTGVTFDLNIADEDKLSKIDKIELYRNDTLVKALEDLTVREFKDLLSNNEYEIRVTYSYDLDDGKGVQTKVVTSKFTTLEKKTPTIEFVRSTEKLEPTKGLKYLKVGNEYKVISYGDNMFDSTIVLGGYIDGLPITTINQHAFLNCAWIKKIVILDTVKLIEAEAFLFSGVEELYFTSSKVPTISDRLFDGNEKSKIIVPDDAFEDYYNYNNAFWITHTKQYVTTYSKMGIDQDELVNGKYDFAITNSSIKFNIKIVDEDLTGSIKLIEVYNGSELVKSLDDLTLREITGLKSNTQYRLKIIYEYDLNDGYSKQTKTIEAKFKTLTSKKPSIKWGEVTTTSSTINFDYELIDLDETAKVDSVDLYLNDKLVESLVNGEKEFTNLLSNSNYTIKLNYSYDLNDGAGTKKKVIMRNVSTLENLEPIYKLENLTSTSSSVAFDLNVTDEDKISTLDKIEIYQNDTLVKSLEDLTLREFKDLSSNSAYTIKITYSYDLNDGTGKKIKTIMHNLNTLAKEIKIVSIEVLPEKPAYNEELSLNATLDNLDAVYITKVMVNGKLYDNTSIDANEINILINGPFKVGTLKLEITEVYYELNGEEVSQKVTLNNAKDIEVHDEITANRVMNKTTNNIIDINSLDKDLVIELNNKQNYKIDKITIAFNGTLIELDQTKFKVEGENIIIPYDIFAKLVKKNDTNIIIINNISATVNKAPLEFVLNTTYSLPIVDSSTKVEINTIEDFDKITESNGYYVLNQDLDLTNKTLNVVNLKGVFNGNNHTIKNFTARYGDSKLLVSSLFNNVNGAVINLNITDFSINFTGISESQFAFICKNASNSLFDNIKVSNSSISVVNKNNSDSYIASIASVATKSCFSNISISKVKLFSRDSKFSAVAGICTNDKNNYNPNYYIINSLVSDCNFNINATSDWNMLAGFSNDACESYINCIAYNNQFVMGTNVSNNFGGITCGEVKRIISCIYFNNVSKIDTPTHDAFLTFSSAQSENNYNYNNSRLGGQLSVAQDGLLATVENLTSKAFYEGIGFSSTIWNLDNLNFETGVYPTLK